MAISKAQQEAVARYNDKNYDSICLRLPAGRKHLVEKLADDNNMSVNMLLNCLIFPACGVASFDVWNNPDYQFEDKRENANYEPMTIKVPPGRRNFLQKVADHHKVSTNDLINTAILRGLGVDPNLWDTTQQRNQATAQQSEQPTE